MTSVSSYLAETLHWVFIAILVLNLTQRRHQARAERKRFATLYVAVLVFVFYLAAQAIVVYGGSDWMLIPVLGAIGGVAYRFRAHVWPFRMRCLRSGQWLTWQDILYDDSNVAASIRDGEEAEDPDREDGSPD